LLQPRRFLLMVPLEKYSYKAKILQKYARGWLLPYLRSRMHSSKFHPIVAHLFTEGKCNIHCHYCYSYYNKMDGMTYDTAVKAIDYLKKVGCRVFGFMGGEPLMRSDFVIKVVEYGAKNGFFVDLATNGLLLTEDIIDQLGQAGIASINLAVDCVEKKPGLPKCLSQNKKIFEYLVENRHKYGYLLFLNVNITSKNMDDARLLTEIACKNEIGIDYHINEAPIDEEGREEYGENKFLLTKADWKELDLLIDFIIAKQQSNDCTIVNSKDHLLAMKDFVRGKLKPWKCHAGHNALVICEDGAIVPCMGLYPFQRDWGSIDDYKFDPERLANQIKECNSKCLSTVHYQLSGAYNNFFANDAWRTWTWR